MPELVIVAVDLIAPVIVAVHVHGNDTLIVILQSRERESPVTLISVAVGG